MPDGMRDNTPTRAALLELKEERHVVHEGYDFLDEKRLLLAAEILRQLRRYQDLMGEFESAHRQAATALTQAAARHGLQGLEVYPAVKLEAARITTVRRSFLGVTLVESTLAHELPEVEVRAMNPSAEARHCCRLFGDVLEHVAVMAGVSSNLFRLMAEYRRTERRARALEDVILPEIEETLHDMEMHLEETDQEEAVRSRLHYNR
ncbi:MAG: V-type ATP synthase subunit D [Gammaproteobacteria bacterium]|jgi:V/A-type H+-transporting ATPase subunit D|nr:V-type ATP synthase subunit D [Gammaproteobacteria bacterium]